MRNKMKVNSNSVALEFFLNFVTLKFINNILTDHLIVVFICYVYLYSKLNNMILKLISVGSVIDTETKMTYAMYQNGTYDKESGVHLNECSKEWVDSLSNDDVLLINENCNFYGV